MTNTQGKTDDLMKLLESNDMHEKLNEAIKHNIEKNFDQPHQVSRKAMVQIK
ncbi:MAG: hypothetical protein GY797_41015 [Deltaproteobacteria bacterium]|nr:hypothetical protein [Deltaproteobacteria bacterium]